MILYNRQISSKYFTDELAVMFIHAVTCMALPLQYQDGTLFACVGNNADDAVAAYTLFKEEGFDVCLTQRALDLDYYAVQLMGTYKAQL